MLNEVAAIIVTHNSQNVLSICLEALQHQTVTVNKIILIDSGSADTSYLVPYEEFETFQVIKKGNIGFSAANNLGCKYIPAGCEFVFFINPDTFLDNECIALALSKMQQDPGAGIVSGKLYWFDVASGKQTKLIDSTGVFRSWYGRWHDRGQASEDVGQYDREESDIPAACGAMMFCRRKALADAGLADYIIFDPDFFMYKEDIELCMRLRAKGWRIVYHPLCVAGHGRGWQRNRKNMPRKIREMAAFNEVMLYRKHPSIYIGWALLKYILVRICNV